MVMRIFHNFEDCDDSDYLDSYDYDDVCTLKSSDPLDDRISGYISTWILMMIMIMIMAMAMIMTKITTMMMMMMMTTSLSWRIVDPSLPPITHTYNDNNDHDYVGFDDNDDTDSYNRNDHADPS